MCSVVIATIFWASIWWPFCLIDPTSLQNLKPFFGHNFGTAQDKIFKLQTGI
jgi:hypothetical protein